MSISYPTHPDLYWALRGGGGNFGIVTRFDMETHPLEPMHGGYYFTPLANTNKHLSDLGMSRSFSWTINSALETSFAFLVQLACRLRYCTTLDAMADIVEDLSLNGASDSSAQAYSVIVKVPYINQYIYVVQMTHGGGLADSAAFRNLNALNYIWNTGMCQSPPAQNSFIWNCWNHTENPRNRSCRKQYLLCRRN